MVGRRPQALVLLEATQRGAAAATSGKRFTAETAAGGNIYDAGPVRGARRPLRWRAPRLGAPAALFFSAGGEGRGLTTFPFPFLLRETSNQPLGARCGGGRAQEDPRPDGTAAHARRARGSAGAGVLARNPRPRRATPAKSPQKLTGKQTAPGAAGGIPGKCVALGRGPIRGPTNPPTGWRGLNKGHCGPLVATIMTKIKKFKPERQEFYEGHKFFFLEGYNFYKFKSFYKAHVKPEFVFKMRNVYLSLKRTPLTLNGIPFCDEDRQF